MEMSLQRLSDVKGLIPSRGVRRRKATGRQRFQSKGATNSKQYLRKLQFKTPQTVKDTVCSSSDLPLPESLGRHIFLQESLKQQGITQ